MKSVLILGSALLFVGAFAAESSSPFFNWQKRFYPGQFPEFRQQSFEPTPATWAPEELPRSAMMYNPYASPHYATTFNRMLPPMDMFRKQEEQILAESRFQALVMAEKFFTTNNKGRSSCFERSFCEVASAEEQDEQQLALLSTVEMMRNGLSVVGKSKSDDFPFLRRLVASYSVGKQTKNSKLCQWLFPCSQENLNQASFMPGQIQGRITCAQSAKVCPGIAIGCGLCAILAPNTCGSICPITAIYCGTAGYVCKEQKEDAMEEEAPVEEEEPEAKALTGSVGKFVEEEEERTVPRAMGRSQEALAGGFGAEEGLEREEQEIRASHVMTKPRVEEVPFMEFHN